MGAIAGMARSYRVRMVVGCRSWPCLQQCPHRNIADAVRWHSRGMGGAGWRPGVTPPGTPRMPTRHLAGTMGDCPCHA